MMTDWELYQRLCATAKLSDQLWGAIHNIPSWQPNERIDCNDIVPEITAGKAAYALMKCIGFEYVHKRVGDELVPTTQPAKSCQLEKDFWAKAANEFIDADWKESAKVIALLQRNLAEIVMVLASEGGCPVGC